MLSSYKFPIDTQPAIGNGDEAKAIQNGFREIQDHMQESCAIGLAGKGILDQLTHVYNECSVPNWDGDNALAIKYTSYLYAWNFLKSFPLDIAPLEIDAEPDGHINLEWYRSPRCILSISVDPDGYLHYAALVGNRKIYGSEKISSTVPKLILDLISEINPQ